MILNVRAGSTYHYAETWPDMAELISKFIREQQVSIPGIGAGDNIVFMFADGRHTAQTSDWWPDNALHVGVNSSTGFGGLVWYVSPKRAEVAGDEKSQWCWVSDNPSPPGFDPMVLSDPGSPMCFDPRSTLPVDLIRAALEEFCRKGSGDRPECIQWVHGEINGERLDA
ncbi:Imm1 family immunity protein [Kitasatospora sp. NPDC097643]|uniref:Imm1 family immunity protein n=1 Tax=Kitasatospora sp. NPDC097643 TaxID=3157230 RepID=UPI003327E36C